MNPHVEKLLKLPTKQKVLLLGLLAILEGGGLYAGLYQPKQKEYQELQKRLEDLHRQADESRRIASNLPQFKREYEALNEELKLALTELPNQKEIPSLLTSISSAGKSAGLDFLLFRPRAEEPKDFYASVPVDIAVSGTYYAIANFFKGVGDLPRIVNISNVTFTDIRESGGRMMMKVSCLATTFRFLNQSEKKDAKK